MAAPDVISCFSALDELIQIIYEGVERFVLLSAIDDAARAWVVHVALHGTGRWWRGAWSEHDLLRLAGPHASEQVLEGWADKIADAIVQGGAGIGDWAPDTGARIHLQLTLGHAPDKPLRLALVEIPAEQAAAHAARVFCSVRTAALAL
ncbi:hypothetical protein HWV62_30791 [Athelia sp. TMB]|nr:hypothetical protein HWV62_30791 [Athelia sp. TMB]